MRERRTYGRQDRERKSSDQVRIIRVLKHNLRIQRSAGLGRKGWSRMVVEYGVWEGNDSLYTSYALTIAHDEMWRS